ncbi:MAG: hypothetical protein J6M44_11845, partial [Butyrivibrio sp.]|nr:hypothetical protein [Butyrivibrio sp.]
RRTNVVMKKKEYITEIMYKVQAVAIAGSIAMMCTPVYASYNFDIKNALTQLLNMVYAFVGVGGIINVLLGARNLGAGLNDDGGGQDQQKISKGKGQLMSGLIGVGAVSVLALFGITPEAVIGQFGA